MEMEHAHPMEISIRHFDVSHLLPLSTNRFFPLNGKQPVKQNKTSDVNSPSEKTKQTNNWKFGNIIE